MSTEFNLTAPCLFGLESIVSFELKKLGAKEVSATNGRVNFVGDENIISKANLWLRTAERVNIVLATFKAQTFEQLFDGVVNIPFEKIIGEHDEFPVKGWSLDSQLESVPACQSIIKRAVVKRMETVYNREIFPETGDLHQIAFSIHKDEVSIMLDTTGDPLYKRGYRKDANIAPIRETLAAGIVDLARMRENSIVYDPMCGSGTLLIEAAQKALNIAPGLKRRFSMEKWSYSNPEIWESARQEARSQVNHEAEFKAFGSDIDDEILEIAEKNAQLAGVGDRINFSRKDIKDFAPSSPSITVCNPPYGERMLEDEDVIELYKTMGSVMGKSKGKSYYIIGPQDVFEPAFGRQADRRRKLYNGMIPCQLYMYFR